MCFCWSCAEASAWTAPLLRSGIGLPVVRLPIEAMGDRVELADHHGDGDDFHLLLPQPPGDQG
jgi:hypothetical protein